jgi:transcriptional accessory protein Tex/SPT6
MPADLSGAFVDIGVHQDGLVHVSALANKFVKDPHEVVKPGQIVKVLDVDVKRQRISLTMRQSVLPPQAAHASRSLRESHMSRLSGVRRYPSIPRSAKQKK